MTAMTTHAEQLPSREFVQSLARGLAVIRAFDADHATLTLSEVAERAAMPRAAARRFLLTLEQLGYVRAEKRAFALTPRVLELGFSYLSALSLPEIAQPHLEQLSREVDESASLAVLDGTDVVYVARVPTRRIMSVSITIGTRFAAYATSLGRVMLAGLAVDEREAILRASNRVRYTASTTIELPELMAKIEHAALTGWALVDNELEDGLTSVAAPVRNRAGVVVAAVNVSMSGRVDSDNDLEVTVAALVRTALAIEADLRTQ